MEEQPQRLHLRNVASVFRAFNYMCVQTPVVSHIDQDIINSVGLELVERGLYIVVKLSEILRGRANEHLTWARLMGC